MKKLVILLLILIAAIGYFFFETKPFSVEQQDDLVADNSELINPNLCTGRFTDFGPCLRLKASFSKQEINKENKTSKDLLDLGIRYELGIGVKTDHKQALKYYLESAKKADNDVYALLSYSLIKEYLWYVDPGIDIDESDYSVSSFGSHSENLFYRLATAVIEERITYRYRLAVTILEEVNKEKYPYAYVLLSEAYIKGLGVEANPSKGIEYLTQGAKAKYPHAMALLGGYYVIGYIVDEDEKLGYEMLQEAIDLGNEGAKELMQQLKENGGKLDV